jgi:hypothetical protein
MVEKVWEEWGFFVLRYGGDVCTVAKGGLGNKEVD